MGDHQNKRMPQEEEIMPVEGIGFKEFYDMKNLRKFHLMIMVKVIELLKQKSFWI